MTENEKKNLSAALNLLTSSAEDLRSHFDEYLNTEYENGMYIHERNYFDDMQAIAHYVVMKFTESHTVDFINIFNSLELIFINYDQMTCSIISAGLLETIQTYEGIDYHNGFNEWLKPITMEWWKGGIEYWENET